MEPAASTNDRQPDRRDQPRQSQPVGAADDERRGFEETLPADGAGWESALAADDGSAGRDASSAG